MSDIWSHSHDWDLGYAKEHKDGYQQGRADADQFLKQWKDDVMNSLCKYDANSVEEVYQLGINRGRADAIEEFGDSIVIKIGLLKQSADDEWVEYALNEIKKFVMNKAYELKEQTE